MIAEQILVGLKAKKNAVRSGLSYFSKLEEKLYVSSSSRNSLRDPVWVQQKNEKLATEDKTFQHFFASKGL